MKRTSIRFRLMVLMICLTTLPVITVTWIATNDTRRSVEKEIINANDSRMIWADQYLNDLIQRIDSLFYSLQINQSLMAALDEMDRQDRGAQFRTVIALNLKGEDKNKFLVELNVSQGLASALERASQGDANAKLPELVRELGVVQETAADLPVLLAVLSSFRDRPLPDKLVAFGEVGLSGEIRPVPNGEERLREAATHGFVRAIVPKANAPKRRIGELEVIGVERLAEAIEAAKGER